jgi:MYXO-CTERM domain-containing protein
VPTRYDADQAPESSAIDRVDTTRTVWKVAGTGTGEKWARSTTTGDGFWVIGDPPQTADHRLTSPAFTIEETSFTLSFKHKWSLKRSTRRNVDIDGGVVEVSVDGGKTWKDISTYGKTDYNVTLDDSARSDNPLKGQKAYGNKSEGYPDQWVTSRIDVSLPEHPEAVQVRFRLGASFGRAADGWAIDDVELIGIASTPFWTYVPHADACDPNGPTTNAGLPQVVASGATVKLTGSASHPSELPLTYLWTQVAGPTVTLNEGATLTPMFTAPNVDAPTTITLALRAHDGALLSPASRVDIVVEPAKESDAGCACRSTPAPRSSVGALGLLGIAALAARRKRRR